MSVRLILKGWCQVSPDDFDVFYQTIEVENKELEKWLEQQKMRVCGSEIITNKKEVD